jgi:phosphoribosyl-dephospho-CoA transferase
MKINDELLNNQREMESLLEKMKRKKKQLISFVVTFKGKMKQ